MTEPWWITIIKALIVVNDGSPDTAAPLNRYCKLPGRNSLCSPRQQAGCGGQKQGNPPGTRRVSGVSRQRRFMDAGPFGVPDETL